MRDFSLFHLYRNALTLVVCTYVVFRGVSWVWRWQIAADAAERREALFRRYLVTLLMRSRVRRFWLELAQVGVLVCILAYLIHRHR